MGIAAIASVIPVRNSCRILAAGQSEDDDERQAAAAMSVMITVSWSSCLVSGVFSCSTPLSIPEMWPTSVDIPVAVTTISPRPR